MLKAFEIFEIFFDGFSDRWIIFISIGYAELGLPVLDPLFIKKIDIEQGRGPVELNLNLNNAIIEGFSGVRFRSIQGLGKNLDKAKVEIKYYQPNFQLSGNYKASGKVLVFPVQGDGRANITLCEFAYYTLETVFIKHNWHWHWHFSLYLFIFYTITHHFCVDEIEGHIKMLTKRVVDKSGKSYMQIDKIRFNFETKKWVKIF